MPLFEEICTCIEDCPHWILGYFPLCGGLHIHLGYSALLEEPLEARVGSFHMFYALFGGVPCLLDHLYSSRGGCAWLQEPVTTQNVGHFVCLLLPHNMLNTLGPLHKVIDSLSAEASWVMKACFSCPNNSVAVSLHGMYPPLNSLVAILCIKGTSLDPYAL